MGRFFASVWVAACVLPLLVPALASAQGSCVEQPSRPGECLPREEDLQAILDEAEGTAGAIDAQDDAAVTPETFVPSCAITFEVLSREAGDENSFGWYNADPDADSPPALDAHYTILETGDGVGASQTVDISMDPSYGGGSIGFFMHNETQGTYFYTENRFNPGSMPGSLFIHRLIYNSVTRDGFYFAWEDRLSPEGGDDDFDDLVTFVSNIVCTGGGEPCDADGMGVCAEGVTQCVGGELTCVSRNQPMDETCDGLDNDCNGSVDDGSGLCAEGELCRFGRCIPECDDFEFPCSAGRTCVDGVCLEEACVDVSCPDGEVCRDGTCTAPCDGVACPHGQQCRFGSCLDPCDGVTCEDDQVCVDGVCRADCACRQCEAALVCDPAGSGRCVDDACVGVDCDSGTFCRDGTCVDACEGATCPAGQRCELGRCVEAPMSSPDGGTGRADGGTGASDGGSGSGDGDAGPDGGGSGAVGSDGCGCRVASESRPPPLALGAVAAVVGLSFLRRRRRGA